MTRSSRTAHDIIPAPEGLRPRPGRPTSRNGALLRRALLRRLKSSPERAGTAARRRSRRRRVLLGSGERPGCRRRRIGSREPRCTASPPTWERASSRRRSRRPTARSWDHRQPVLRLRYRMDAPPVLRVQAVRSTRANIDVVLPSRLRAWALPSLALATIALSATFSASAAALRPGQIITVEAATPLSRVAVLRTWRLSECRHLRPRVQRRRRLRGGKWRTAHARGLGRDPVGEFTLTQAFGNEPNNGTRLPYAPSAPTTGGTEPQLGELQPARRQRGLSRRQFREPLLLGLRLRPRRGHQLQHGSGRQRRGQRVLPARSSGAPTEGCVAIPAGPTSIRSCDGWIRASIPSSASTLVGRAGAGGIYEFVDVVTSLE